MPTIREVEVLRREGNQVWLRNHLRILWVDIQSHPMYVLHPRQGRITWRLDPTREQEFDRVEGVWQIVPLESGDGCLAEYRVLLDSGRWIPGFVEEMLTRRSLPDLLRSLDREAAAQTTGTLIPGRRSDRSPR
jgi:hypothetical protein